MGAKEDRQFGEYLAAHNFQLDKDELRFHTASGVAMPGADYCTAYFDSTDSKFKVKKSTGAIVNLEWAQADHDTLANPHHSNANDHANTAVAHSWHTTPQAFPVGSVFLSVVSTDPATLLGYGTWTQIAQGQFLVGQKATDVDFDTAEKIGGAKTHTHAAHIVTQPADHTANIAHTHPQTVNSGTTGALSGYTPDTSTSTPATSGYNTGSSGSGASLPHSGGSVDAHNSSSHLPPYLVVFVWKRTA